MFLSKKKKRKRQSNPNLPKKKNRIEEKKIEKEKLEEVPVGGEEIGDVGGGSEARGRRESRGSTGLKGSREERDRWRRR